MEASPEEKAAIRAAVVRLRARIFALVFAVVSGAGVWLATVWLIARGGPNVGEHLSLLRSYMPGFSVTLPGAFVGLFWGAVYGAVAGWLFAWIYNRIARRQSRNQQA